MLKITNIKIPLSFFQKKDDLPEEMLLTRFLSKELREREDGIRRLSILKKSIDARKKPDIFILYAIAATFPEEDRLVYESVISRADSVLCTSARYSKDCYAVRNRYMVENSEKLIAFVNNYRSGTGQTINYARRTGLITDITDLSDIAFNMKYKQLEFE